jgi:exportin-1
VAKNGPGAARTSLLLNMRTVKKETLRLFETFIEKTEEPQVVYRNYVPPLLEAVLGDYKSNIPDARDPEVRKRGKIEVSTKFLCS